MALGYRRILHATIALVFVLLAGSAVASAATIRPNALDRRVDAIPAYELLTRPAVALVDPDRQAAAIRLVHLTLPGWIAMALFEAAALFYFWSSGSAAALRDRLRRSLRGESAVRFWFGAALALIARAAAVLPAFYLYRVERVMGLSGELTRTWAVFWIGHTLLAMIVAGLIATGILWLVDRTHQWYLYTIVAILAVSLGWSFASPYFEVPGSHAIVPIGGQLGDRLRNMVQRAGFDGIPVLVQTAPTAADHAVVTGLGASRRVVVAENLIRGNSQPEVLFAVAVALGQIALGSPIFVALIEGGIIIVFSAIAVVIADRVPFRRDDDPLSRLAVVGMLLALVYLIAVPVRNASLRSYDLDADRYAVRLIGDRAAAVRAIVRAADQHMDEVCPEMSATFFLYTHPTAGIRVQAINGVPDRCP
ncbi:MAG TPA: M48 family metalloprotease [Candidatus Baltobacteraceae bacterium]|nr:M48 family metalloprotease [Candidatus Baltobacteraceae bacterium]